MNLKYSKEHLWVKSDGTVIKLGITNYAQEQLSDVVYLEIPTVGDKLKFGESFGTVESVKSVSTLYAPVSGTVTKINVEVVDDPDMINRDPQGEAWFLEVKPEDFSEIEELLNEEQYNSYLVEINN